MDKELRRMEKAELPSRELKRYTKQPKVTNPLRRTPEYQQFHKEMIKANPICAKKDCDNSATDIHHIKRITEFPELIFEPANVICTCHDCHLLIESAVNRNIDPEIWKHLFEGL